MSKGKHIRISEITKPMYYDYLDNGSAYVRVKYGLKVEDIKLMSKNIVIHDIPNGYEVLSRLDKMCGKAEMLIDKVEKDPEGDLTIIIRAMKAVSDLSKTIFLGFDVAERIEKSKIVSSEQEYEQIMVVIRDVLTHYPVVGGEIATALEKLKLDTKITGDKIEYALDHTMGEKFELNQ